MASSAPPLKLHRLQRTSRDLARVGFRTLASLRLSPADSKQVTAQTRNGTNCIGTKGAGISGDKSQGPPSRRVSKLGWEGIVSKNAQAPYRSERTEAWLKIKTSQRGKFPVIGFVKDPTDVAALYLGKREGKDLVYMGKRSARDGLGRSPAKSASSSMPSSALSPSGPGPSKSRRPRGWNHHLSRMWSTAILRRKICSGRVR